MSSFVRAPNPGLMSGERVIIEAEAIVKPKRYLVFAGERYYPIGGWQDFMGSADTEADAIEAANAAMANGCSWFHVVDIETGQEVA